MLEVELAGQRWPMTIESCRNRFDPKTFYVVNISKKETYRAMVIIKYMNKTL